MRLTFWFFCRRGVGRCFPLFTLCMLWGCCTDRYIYIGVPASDPAVSHEKKSPGGKKKAWQGEPAIYCRMLARELQHYNLGTAAGRECLYNVQADSWCVGKHDWVLWTTEIHCPGVFCQFGASWPLLLSDTIVGYYYQILLFSDTIVGYRYQILFIIYYCLILLSDIITV